MQLTVNASALRRYRRRALRAQPREYLECLVGTKDGDKLFVEDIVAVKQYATDRYVSVDLADFDRVEREVADSGRILLGNIHSHPYWTTDTPSEIDNTGAREFQEYLFGIFHIGKKGLRTRTTTKWWPTQNPISTVRYQ